MTEKTSGQFLASPDVTRVQYGAVCWRIAAGCVQVLLITSRDTGRWIIPKGWPVAGLTGEATAAREAWEEAGVVGAPHPESIGLYTYDKLVDAERAIPCMVAVYPLKVRRLHSRYPESHQRRRKWFSPDKAARKVDEPELKHLLDAFVPPEVPTD